MSATAVIHLGYLSNEFTNFPYVGLASAAIILGFVASIALLGSHDRRGWFLAAAVATVSVAGFAVLRIASPFNGGLTPDDWDATPGTVAAVMEVVLVVLASIALRLPEEKARRSPSHRSQKF